MKTSLMENENEEFPCVVLYQFLNMNYIIHILDTCFNTAGNRFIAVLNC
jgi:hypothetical protein